MPPEQAVANALDLSPKRRLMTLICIALAVGTNAFNSVNPFYAGYALARNPAGGPEYHAAVGAVYSVHQFSSIAVMPCVVADLPNIGGKTMLVLALGAEGGAHMLFALLGKIADWKVFLGFSYCIRAIEGATFVATHVAALSCLVKLFPRRMGFASGFLLTSLSVGHSAAELLVGGLYDVGGFEAPFLVTGCMMLAVSVFTALFMVDVDRMVGDEVTAAAVVPATAAVERHVSSLAVLRVPWVLLAHVVLTLVNVAYGAAAALLAVRMKSEFGSSATVFSVAFGIQIAINALLAPVVGALLDRGWRARPMIVAGATLMGLGCLLIGPADFLHLPNSLWLVFVTQVPWGVGRIMALVAGMCFIYQHCERIGLGTVVELRVAVAGLTRTAMTLGYSLGPPVCSPLTAVIGFKKTFMLLGFVNFALAALVTLAFFLSKAKESVQTSCRRANGDGDDDGRDSELLPLKP